MIVIVPAATTQGSQTYTLQKFFTVDDDDINEVEQSFALLAEIGDDVPDNCYVESEGRTECSCFQIQVGATECLGRSGATKIRITDNDRKFSVLCAKGVENGFWALSQSHCVLFTHTRHINMIPNLH